MPDDRYLDGRAPKWLASLDTTDPAEQRAVARIMASAPALRDDFVRLPVAQLAAADPAHAPIGAAAERYRQEAKVVDARLFRKVTLAIRGDSLETLCEDLHRQTGVSLRTARGVRDEKVTVFAEGLPARDVMRAVARLFGYLWARSGDPGQYRYELMQDLRGQLAEEEMRNRDVDEALIAMDDQMQGFAPLLDLPIDQLRARRQSAQGEEKQQIDRLFHGGWGPAQVYRRLTPADVADLRNGKELNFSAFADDAEHRIPSDWGPILAETGRQEVMNPSTGKFEALSDFPDARGGVHLRLDRNELGEFRLQADTGFYSKTAGYGLGFPQTLAVGKSPSVANPDNAKANHALEGKPPFDREVEIRPKATCPNLDRWDKPWENYNSADLNAGTSERPKPHFHSYEVWEEIHRRTGLPVVADFYTRLYPTGPFEIKSATAFDALCRCGDALGARWRKDGEFILARSTGFFWDKLKEVPAQLIRRWQEDREREGGLPLADVLEMASLSDAQLNSSVVAEGMRRCYGLQEWDLVGAGHDQLRPWVRFLATLTPQQLVRATSAECLPLAALTAEQQQVWLRFQSAPPPDARLEVAYVPAGRYVWMPVLGRNVEKAQELEKLPVISGKTVDEVLALGRKHYAGTVPSDVRRSTGTLAIRVLSATGEVTRVGKPPTLVSAPGE